VDEAFMGSECADPERRRCLFDLAQVLQPGNIHNDFGAGKAQFEQGDEALPARHDLGVVVGRKDGQCIVEGVRGGVGER
jgi:hypothetical protein